MKRSISVKDYFQFYVYKFVGMLKKSRVLKLKINCISSTYLIQIEID